MNFANPYNFVVINEENVPRETELLYHEKFSGNGNSGRIRCNIIFRTNFITAGINTNRENRERKKKTLRINEEYGIQGSTLKGMLRATAEAISNSCISMMLSSHERYVNKNVLIKSCDKTNGLCICCRLFGTTVKDDFTFKGKITLSDAIHKKLKYLFSWDQNLVNNNERLKEFLKQDYGIDCVETAEIETIDNNKTIKMSTDTNSLLLSLNDENTKVNLQIDNVETDEFIVKMVNEELSIFKLDTHQRKYLKNHSLSSPKPQHENFYFNGNKIKGRKFYYHHNQDGLSNINEEQAYRVELIRSGSIFQFEITFENLTEEEYGLLLFTLELEPELGHKIGMGKPLGLGSCIIEVEEIKEFTKKRYQSLSEEDRWIIYNENNNNLIDRKDEIKKWWKKEIPPELECILKLDNKFSEIRYPNRNGNEFSISLHSPCKEFP